MSPADTGTVGDIWVLLRDWKLLAASAMIAVALATAIVAPPFVNAEPAIPVSLADPVAPYRGIDADQLRRDDLAWLAQTMDGYGRVWGSYPETAEGPSPVCSRLADVTCMLWTAAPDMLASDGATPYYYASDGDQYTFFALMDAPSPRPCDEDSPPGWDQQRTFCVISSASNEGGE